MVLCFGRAVTPVQQEPHCPLPLGQVNERTTSRVRLHLKRFIRFTDTRLVTLGQDGFPYVGLNYSFNVFFCLDSLTLEIINNGGKKQERLCTVLSALIATAIHPLDPALLTAVE